MHRLSSSSLLGSGGRNFFDAYVRRIIDRYSRSNHFGSRRGLLPGYNRNDIARLHALIPRVHQLAVPQDLATATSLRRDAFNRTDNEDRIAYINRAMKLPSIDFGQGQVAQTRCRTAQASHQ